MYLYVDFLSAINYWIELNISYTPTFPPNDYAFCNQYNFVNILLPLTCIIKPRYIEADRVKTAINLYTL